MQESQGTTLQSLMEELQALIESQQKNVDSFQEHLELAKKLADDERISTFIDHTLDEEQERQTKLNKALSALSQLKNKLPETPSNELLTVSTAVQVPSSEGHYKLRDENILTVGNLMGQNQ